MRFVTSKDLPDLEDVSLNIASPLTIVQNQEILRQNQVKIYDAIKAILQRMER